MEDDPTFEIIESQRRPPTRLDKKTDGFSRMDVVNAFAQAFDMIGGVNRLTLWANKNPDKFYPLYAKMMPSTSINITGDGHKITIEHSLPRTNLDDHPADL